MSALRKRSSALIIMAGITVCLVATSLGFAGCGSDQSKQDFVNGMLSIIEENQAQPEIAEAGQAAFQVYHQSGFTDLESAAAAADSFNKSNEKDDLSLRDLEALQKPDENAEEIAGIFGSGIDTMDEGNTVYARELDKAPGQSVEERSQIFAASGEAMGDYLEGIADIIASFELLLDYVKDNGLEGEEDIQGWLDGFHSEKDSIEQSLKSISGG
jgi:hypothetical protein